MNKYKTYKLTKDMIPGEAFHPGELLKDEIEYRGISQKELADRMNIAPTVLSGIIHGKQNFTAEVALKIEKALDIDAIVWMRLQAKFEIDRLRIFDREKKKEIPPQKTRAGILPYPVHNSPSVVREPKINYNMRKAKKRK